MRLAYGYSSIQYPLLNNVVYNSQNEANRSPHFILLLLFIYKEENTQRFTQANDDPFTHYPRWYRKHPWIACPCDRVGNTRQAPFVGYG